MRTTLHMLHEQSMTQMMSYILQTREGKLIVIDGGTRQDARHLQDTLIRLGGPEPTVDLWLLTHPHLDHVDALLEIFSGPAPLEVKSVYSHFLSYEFYRANDFQGCTDAETTRQFNAFAAAHPDICHTLEKGQRFVIDDLEINVLHVPEGETLPMNVINNSSVVFRVDAEGQRILFVGDLGEEAGDRVLETVPPQELQVDFIQMAHHGQNGVKRSFYEAAAPKACLWNTPCWLWDNDAGGGYDTGPWKTVEVRHWMEELGVRHHFISKDGDQALELPYQLDEKRVQRLKSGGNSMKIQYLGTGAAEGIPGLFCHCPICEYAREHGGKEIRTRAQAIVNDDLLLDFGPDTYMHVLQHGLDLAKVEICLITHPHGDHFNADEFILRGRGFVTGEMEIPVMYVYGSPETEAALQSAEDGAVFQDGRVVFRRAVAYETFTHKDYSITPLPAVHGTTEPFIYLIRQSGRALLYAHDTDIFPEEVWDYLQQSKILLNLVSLDCTQGARPIDYVGHMNLERNFIVRERMLEAGVANGDTVFVANHFSHNGGMNHDRGLDPEINRGIAIAYDGMVLEV